MRPDIGGRLIRKAGFLPLSFLRHQIESAGKLVPEKFFPFGISGKSRRAAQVERLQLRSVEAFLGKYHRKGVVDPIADLLQKDQVQPPFLHGQGQLLESGAQFLAVCLPYGVLDFPLQGVLLLDPALGTLCEIPRRRAGQKKPFCAPENFGRHAIKVIFKIPAEGAFRLAEDFVVYEQGALASLLPGQMDGMPSEQRDAVLRFLQSRDGEQISGDAAAAVKKGLRAAGNQPSMVRRRAARPPSGSCERAIRCTTTSSQKPSRLPSPL